MAFRQAMLGKDTTVLAPHDGQTRLQQLHFPAPISKVLDPHALAVL